MRANYSLGLWVMIGIFYLNPLFARGPLRDPAASWSYWHFAIHDAEDSGDLIGRVTLRMEMVITQHPMGADVAEKLKR